MDKINGIVIQHGFGDHAEMLRLTSDRHRSWAASHGLGYHASLGKLQTIRPCCWDKLPAIRSWLNTPVELVVWLDTDCLVKNLDVDPRDAVNDDCDIAMVHTPRVEDYYNSGAMFIRNSEPMRRFFEQVWNKGPVQDGRKDWLGMGDERRICQELALSPHLKVRTLEWCWNYFVKSQAVGAGIDPEDAEENCIIKAWHGTPATTTLRRITETLNKWQS